MARYNFADVVRRMVSSGEKMVYEYGMIVVPENTCGEISVITRRTRSRKYPDSIAKYIVRFVNRLGEPEKRIVYYGDICKKWSVKDRTLHVVHEATVDEMIEFLDFLYGCHQYDAFKDMLKDPIPDAEYEYCAGALYEDDESFIITCSQPNEIGACNYIEIEKSSGSVQYRLRFYSRLHFEDLKLIGLVEDQLFQKILKIAVAAGDETIYLLPENATRKDVEAWLYPWSVKLVEQFPTNKKK